MDPNFPQWPHPVCIFIALETFKLTETAEEIAKADLKRGGKNLTKMGQM